MQTITKAEKAKWYDDSTGTWAVDKLPVWNYDVRASPHPLESFPPSPPPSASHYDAVACAPRARIL